MHSQPHILFLLLLLALASPAGAEQALLVRVIDGDTIVVDLAGDEVTVRLLAIDTPERGQPGYAEATEYVERWCARRGGVLDLEYERRRLDKYGRTLAWAWGPDGKLLNRELIDAGLARTFMLKYTDHPERVK